MTHTPGVIIYFDMDGVLADFEAGKDLLLGAKSPELNQPRDRLTAAQQAVKDKMWAQVEAHPSFFLDLPPLADGVALYHALSPYKRVILTASPEFSGVESSSFKGVVAQKFSWCQKHLGSIEQADFICTLSHLKQEYKGRHGGFLHVLIDDRFVNCQAWQQAGGVSIVYNPKSLQPTLNALESMGISPVGYSPLPHYQESPF